MEKLWFAVAILLLAVAVGGQARLDEGLIPSDAKFTPDAVEGLSPTGSVVSKQMTGSYNGVKYRYYFDGSGAFEAEKDAGVDSRGSGENWKVFCGKDSITDEKFCYLTRDVNLFVYLLPNGRVSVSVGMSVYPGSSIAIRVDEKPAYIVRWEKGFEGAKAAEIVAAIKKGKKITTRFQKWPYEANVDATFGTYGFPEALEYLKWALSKIK